MAPRAKQDPAKLAREVEAADVSYEDALQEFKAALDEFPQNRMKILSRIPVFQSEADKYFELKKTYEDLLAETNGQDDEQKERLRSTARRHREAREILSLAKLLTGQDDDDFLSVVSVKSGSTPEVKNRRKLPKLGLPRFSGEVRDWLAFWSQFEEIHKDTSIPAIDKFQYLIQSMEDDTLAKRIVQSYPVSSKNYQLAVDSLTERYGRHSVLVKVYVRDLLKLVIGNANKEVTDFSNMFVQLSSQLRALGTLGVTSDRCASIIYPLVECCLPEEIMRAWQRDPVYGTSDDSGKELEHLIDFLKREVRGEDNIKLASGGLSAEKEQSNEKKNKSLYSKRGNSGPTTAASLLGTTSSDVNQKKLCVFCGNTHSSENCRKASQMTIEEKRKILKEKNCCFVCLKEGHSAKKCRSSTQCINCSGRHETVMCFNLLRLKKQVESDEEKPIKEKSEEAQSSANMSNFTKEKSVFLKTLVVYVHGNSKAVKARAIIDDGSHKSYIVKSLADTLGLQHIGKEKVIHSLFGGKKTEVQEHRRYILKLSDLEDQYSCKFQVSDSDKISGRISCYHKGPWSKELELHGITLSDMETNNDPVDILLGADVAGSLLTGYIKKLKCGPVAVQTKLGWTLIGETKEIKDVGKYGEDFVETGYPGFSSVRSVELHTADEEIEKLWNLDCLGIKDPAEPISKLQQEQMVVDHFNQTVQMDEEGRVQVKLPWIPGHKPLPKNRWIAERKLEITTNKLLKDGKLQEYDTLFKQWEESGIIEEVLPIEDDTGGHYLQHRAVYNPNSSTTPTRPVFNASYKKKGEPSLNDCLEKGPNLLELIPAVVTRFRLDKIGVLADIKKAFQQISVAPEDRNSSLFLWWSDLSRQKIKVYRHRRVVFGINSSPFLLAATIKYILSLVPEDQRSLALLLGKSLYVDNLAVAVGSLEEAEVLKSQACKLLSTAKMELRGWEIGPGKEKEIVSLLGMKWDKDEDTLFCVVSEKTSDIGGHVTRRGILSLANSVFDPLGFLSPYLLNFKVLIQETWISEGKNIGWDTPVGESANATFQKLKSQLDKITLFQIPRWITAVSMDRRKWTLHICVDGSKSSYAATAFLRIQDGENVSVHLLQARSRVTPIKPLTIPRIELMGCVIGARLAAFVKESLEFPEIQTFYWTDSSTALYWILNDKDWGVFVRNRVLQILQHSSRDEWRHIPGKLNPADLPSRGCNMDQLIESRWWEGPSWLYSQQEEWPRSEVQVDKAEIQQEERKTAVTSLNLKDTDNKIYEKICALPDYDSMIKLITEDVEDITVENAELYLFQLVQRIHFKGRTDARLNKLDILETDKTIMKIKTRLFYGHFDENFRCPIVLPSESPVVHCLIMKTHLDNSHGGIQFLMSKLRENYWILKSRKTIRGVLKLCLPCQRFSATPVVVNTPPLPPERIEAENPFEVTGIDLCGPLFLKDKRKVWIVLFTCAVYRAVHLELVTSMTTDQFKMALRRFVSRRGKPKTIFSDNGTNLVGCHNEMKRVDWKKLQKSTPGEGIDWRFIPPAAPWWGGWWERLIGLVKDLLRKSIGQATLSQMELITILADIEGTINQRPLTYLSEDANDLVPLTPYMFLVGNMSSSLPDLDLIDGKSLNKRIQYMQRIRVDLRSRFQKEYLGQLNNLKQRKESPGVKLGDVVLLQCDNLKRLHWPIAKILELIPGRDGKIRVVRLQTKEGEIKRPIQRIYPLEVPFEGEQVGEKFILPKQLTLLSVSSVTGTLQ